MNSKQSKTKKRFPPEKVFTGIELKVAEAIYANDPEEIKKLIKIYNLDVNSIKSDKMTYLYYAVFIQNKESVEALLQLGANPNQYASFENQGYTFHDTPISYAAEVKNIPIIKKLIEYKTNLNPSLNTPLSNALIGDGGKEAIELLVNHGADVNHQDYIGGDTPIFTARRINKFEYVHYFLDKGADPLLLDYVGNSFAYLVQKEIAEGRLSEYGLEEYTKIKERLIKEFHVKFPLKNELKNGMEKAIKRYEGLSQTDKDLLGESEIKRMQLFKECIVKGVSVTGKPFDADK